MVDNFDVVILLQAHQLGEDRSDDDLKSACFQKTHNGRGGARGAHFKPRFSASCEH